MLIVRDKIADEIEIQIVNIAWSSISIVPIESFRIQCLCVTVQTTKNIYEIKSTLAIFQCNKELL